MATKQRKDFLLTQEGEDIQATLLEMTLDSTYNTPASYSSDSFKYPDNLMPFADKHLNYLIAHPKLDAGMYLANLKLMSRIR